MDTIYIHLIDSSKQIPFVMTYGLHRELQDFLLQDNRLLSLLTNVAISDEVIRLCLSERNDMGQIVTEFVEVQQVEVEDMILLINNIFDYFSDFFLKNNQKMQKLTQSLNQISLQSPNS